MAYDAHYSLIFAALGYTNNASDGQYVWTADTPSAGIIAAVEALPDNMTDLINLDITSDEDCVALQALVSGAFWTAFSTWHDTQWKIECKTEIDDNTLTGFLNCCAIYNGSGFADCRATAKAALTAAGITRHPF